MTLQELIDHCSEKPGVTQEFPFDETTLVMKVVGKMFALTGMKAEVPSVNLKCDPVYAESLRQKFKSVRPGYHMDKKHWNTVELSGDVPDDLLKELIDDSYKLVVDKLTGKQREELAKSGE